MAVVFRAYDPVMRRTVAIKRLKDDVAKDTAAVKRFINESKAVSMLSHPNIISIYDVSMSGESKYIVMEYVEGITLKNYMMKKVRFHSRRSSAFVSRYSARWLTPIQKVSYTAT